VKLYLRYLSMHLRTAMEYKASFWSGTLGQFLVSFSAYLTVRFLMDRFGAVEGFTYAEVLLCFGAVLMAFALAECFARGFDTFSRLIGNGQFDRMMVRPRSLIFQVLATKVEFTRLGRFLQAALVLAWAVARAPVAWTPARALVLAEMILCGAALFGALFLCYAGLCFFTTEGLEVVNILTDGSREFGAYPLSVYGKTALRFYTYLVPLACVQYYPLLWLLGRDVPAWYALLPLGGAAFLLPAYGLWRLGLRHYKSTGS